MNHFQIRVLKHLGAFVFLGALGLNLSACGLSGAGPSSDDTAQAKSEQDNERKMEVFSTVTGAYRGTLSTPDSAQPLGGQIILYVEYVQDGVDANSSTLSHPVLRAQLKLDGVGELDDHSFSADFKEVTGAIQLIQTSTGGMSSGSAGVGAGNPNSSSLTACSVGPHDPLLAVTGKILGDKFNGTWSGSNGLLGKISMTRTSTDSTQPARDQRERLLKAYNKVTGTYGGMATVGSEKDEAQVILNIQEKQIGEGITCPMLKAQFKYTKAIGKLNDTSFNVAYRESTGELHLSGETSGNLRACAVGPNDPLLTMDGALKNSVVSGELRGTQGSLGVLTLNKISNNSTFPDDQRNRLLAAYGKVEGVYGGRFSGPTDAFPVKIVVTVVEDTSNPFINCPKLVAQYSRPDIDPSFGQLVLSADYHPAESLLNLTSITTSTTGVSGHTDLKISAHWTESGFTGPMVWWTRIGTVTTSRCHSSDVSSKGSCTGAVKAPPHTS
jgi:hypothetical protein